VDGTLLDNWGATPIRVTDLAITPDLTRLVTVGMYYNPTLPSVDDSPQPTRNNTDSASVGSGGNGVLVNGSKGSDNRMIVYDLITKQTESCVGTRMLSIRHSAAIGTHHLTHGFFYNVDPSGWTANLRVSRYLRTRDMP
jgi:hypothetical protein